MSSSTGQLQRQGTIRRISRPASSSQHSGPFHRGDAESFRLCDEGGELLAAKREIIRLEGILEAKQKKKSSRAALIVKEFDEAPVEDVMENNKDFMLLHGKQVRDYVTWRQERATLEVCQGPSSKGICRACARLLQRMEQRDCFLADDESSTEEEAPAEAALDPGPGGDRKDHLSDDDGGDLLSEHLSLA